MKDILRNLANIHLIKFSTGNGIDCSGTYVVKNGRGFKYSLVKSDTGLEVLSITFHKSSVPTYSVRPIV